MNVARFAVVSLMSVSLAGCGANVEPLDDGGLPFDSSNRNDGSAGFDGDARVDGSTVVASDLPCEVRDFLEAHCASCHGPTPRAGAPRLTSFADLSAQSARFPGQTEAQRSLARITDAVSPMPPGAPLPAATYAAFAQWVQLGAPVSRCGSASDAGMAEAGVDPFSLPPQCSSGRTWTSGNRGSTNMNPGQPCIACHQRDPEAPGFSIAGTLYRTGHEPDNCYGGVAAGSPAAIVEITDSRGIVLSLPAASSGNFFTQRTITPPYTARVLFGGRALVMSAPQTNGDCNVCHTQSGTMGAPGRIVLP